MSTPTSHATNKETILFSYSDNKRRGFDLAVISNTAVGVTTIEKIFFTEPFTLNRILYAIEDEIIDVKLSDGIVSMTAKKLILNIFLWRSLLKRGVTVTHDHIIPYPLGNVSLYETLMIACKTIIDHTKPPIPEEVRKKLTREIFDEFTNAVSDSY